MSSVASAHSSTLSMNPSASVLGSESQTFTHTTSSGDGESNVRANLIINRFLEAAADELDLSHHSQDFDGEVIPQTDLQRYESLFGPDPIGSVTDPFSATYHTDDPVIQEDTLHKLAQQYPDSLAFSLKEDMTTHKMTLGERLLEYSVESLVRKRAELHSQRRQTYNRNIPTLPRKMPLGQRNVNIRSLRTSRSRTLDDLLQVPTLDPPPARSSLLRAEFDLTRRRLHTASHMRFLISRMYERLQHQLYVEKEGVLRRWVAVSGGCAVGTDSLSSSSSSDIASHADRVEGVVLDRISQIEKEWEFVNGRLMRIGRPQHTTLLGKRDVITVPTSHVVTLDSATTTTTTTTNQEEEEEGEGEVISRSQSQTSVTSSPSPSTPQPTTPTTTSSPPFDDGTTSSTSAPTTTTFRASASPLLEHDYIIFLRNFLSRSSLASRSDRLVARLKYLHHLHRFSLLYRANHLIHATSRKKKGGGGVDDVCIRSPPLMVGSVAEIDRDLVMLGASFGLAGGVGGGIAAAAAAATTTGGGGSEVPNRSGSAPTAGTGGSGGPNPSASVTLDGGDEMVFTVSKRFNAVFVNQTQHMQVEEYPTHVVLPNELDAYFFEKLQESQDGGFSFNKTYLKGFSVPVPHPFAPDPTDLGPDSIPSSSSLSSSTNLESEEEEKEPNSRLMKQRIILESVEPIDTHLRVEMLFLREQDVSYAKKRLEETVDSHFDRTYIASSSASRRRRPQVEGGRNTTNKLASLYMLRLIRIREFRKRLLQILNYFESVRRRVLLDRRSQFDAGSGGAGGGFVKSEQADSFMARSFPRASDLTGGDGRGSGDSEQDLIRARAAIGRDDVYLYDDGPMQSFVVKDSNGIKIVYKSALDALENRDHFLLRLGSHFIMKHGADIAAAQRRAHRRHHHHHGHGTRHRRRRHQQPQQAPEPSTSASADAPTIDVDNPDALREVDRWVMLEHLYESDTWFNDGKRKLVDLYFEAYDHCLEPKIRRRLGKILLEIIDRDPLIDLTPQSRYFTRSYASEIVGLELHARLIKDVVARCVVDEKQCRERIHVGASNMTAAASSELMLGYPRQELETSRQVGGDERLMRFLPHGTPFGFLDFYSSMSKIGKIYHALDNCLEELIHDFDIKSPLVVSALRRVLIQQTIVEWKTLSEEGRIQDAMHVRFSPERRGFEDDVMLKDAESLVSILQAARGDLLDPQGLARWFEKAGQGSETTGGYPLPATGSELDPFVAQVYSNAIEMAILWRNTILELQQTDVLQEVYYSQAMVPGIKVLVQIRPQLSNRPNAQRFIQLAAPCTSLAIGDFVPSMGDICVNTFDGLRRLVQDFGLDLLRCAFQYQWSHRKMFESVVQYNRFLVDDYVMSHHDETFVTAQDGNPRISRRIVKGRFLTASFFTQRLKQEVLAQCESRVSSVTGEGVQLENRKLDIRTVFARMYVKRLVDALVPYIDKTQLVEMTNRVRSVLSFVENQGTADSFILGRPADRVFDTFEDYVAARGAAPGNASPGVDDEDDEDRRGGHPTALLTCLLTKNGRTIHPLYVPHYLQLLSHSAQETTTLFDDMSSLLFSQYVILHLLLIRQSIQLSGTQVLQETSYTLETMTRLYIQISSLFRKDGDTDVATRIMLQISTLLYRRTLISLERLRTKFLIAGPSKSRSEKVVRRTIARFLRKEEFHDEPFSEPELWIPELVVDRRLAFFPSLHCPHRSFLTALEDGFLLELSSSDRNYFRSEDIHVDLELDQILADEGVDTGGHHHGPSILGSNTSSSVTNSSRPIIYATADSKTAVDEQLKYSGFWFSLLFMKRWFLKTIRSQSKFSSREYDDPQNLEDLFDTLIMREALRMRDQMERVLQELRDKGVTSGSSSQSEGLQEGKMMNLMKRRLDLLKQQTNKLLLVRNAKDLRLEIAHMAADMRLSSEIAVSGVDYSSSGSSSNMVSIRHHQRHQGNSSSSSIRVNKHLLHEREYGFKMEMFRSFIIALRRDGQPNRTKSGDSTLTISENHLHEAFDRLGEELHSWKKNELEQIRRNRDDLLRRYKRMAFLNGQMLQFSRYRHRLDQLSFQWRVDGEVANKYFDLVFRVACLNRESQALSKQLSSDLSIAREQVKEEYKDLIRKMYAEILKVQSQFSSYQSNFYRELQTRFADVKRETQDVVQVRFKRNAEFREGVTRVFQEDHEQGRQKVNQMDADVFQERLRVLHKIRLAAKEARHEEEMRRMQDQIDELEKSRWGVQAAAQEREHLLRQELVKTQDKLSNSQMEVSRVKKLLDDQKRDQEDSTEWKTKHRQDLDDLQRKVQRLMRLERTDVDVNEVIQERDQLVLQVENQETEIANLERRIRLVEKSANQRVKDMEKKLVLERRLKERAFRKLNALQSISSSDTTTTTDSLTLADATSIDNRYFDAVAELKLALNEINILRSLLKAHRIDVPDFEDLTSQRRKKTISNSNSNTIIRQNRHRPRPRTSSASTSRRRVRQQGTRSGVLSAAPPIGSSSSSNRRPATVSSSSSSSSSQHQGQPSVTLGPSLSRSLSSTGRHGQQRQKNQSSGRRRRGGTTTTTRILGGGSGESLASAAGNMLPRRPLTVGYKRSPNVLMSRPLSSSRRPMSSSGGGSSGGGGGGFPLSRMNQQRY